jgi:hypothetical protein
MRRLEPKRSPRTFSRPMSHQAEDELGIGSGRIASGRPEPLQDAAISIRGCAEPEPMRSTFLLDHIGPEARPAFAWLGRVTESTGLPAGSSSSLTWRAAVMLRAPGHQWVYCCAQYDERWPRGAFRRSWPGQMPGRFAVAWPVTARSLREVRTHAPLAVSHRRTVPSPQPLASSSVLPISANPLDVRW